MCFVYIGLQKTLNYISFVHYFHFYPYIKVYLFSDIDECTSGKDNCDANALCINTEGSYQCNCKPGYFGDGQFCKSEVFHIIKGVNVQTIIHMLKFKDKKARKEKKCIFLTLPGRF